MGSPAMRVPPHVKHQIEMVAAQLNMTPQVVLARAMEAYTHGLLLEQWQESGEALRKQPARWRALEAERRSEDRVAALDESGRAAPTSGDLMPGGDGIAERRAVEA